MKQLKELMSVADLARAVGAKSYGVIKNHILAGRIPAPSIPHGAKNYYSVKQFDELVKKWK
jgi:hypothetical protein